MITYIFSSIIGNDTLSPLRIRVNLNYKIVELNKKKKKRSQNIIHLFWYSLRVFSIFIFFCEINSNSIYRYPQRLRNLNSRLFIWMKSLVIPLPTRLSYQVDPFFSPKQVIQVCYVSYLNKRRERENWIVVCTIKARATNWNVK